EIDAGPGAPLACALSSEPGDVIFFDFDGDIVDGVSGNPGTHGGSRLAGTSPCGGSAVEIPARDSFFLVDDRPGFDLNEGSIDFWAFLPPPPGAASVFFSRDALGAALPGHLSVFMLADGFMLARLQSTTEVTGAACGDAIAFDAWHRIGINFGSEGFELWVDGERQTAPPRPKDPFASDCGTDVRIGLGNDNPITLGYSQVLTVEGGLDLALPERDTQPPSYAGLRIDNLRVSTVRRDYAAEIYP
ncbi:MAG: hypothetical protein AAF645_07310, partial [Myxococcota bacterium]